MFYKYYISEKRLTDEWFTRMGECDRLITNYPEVRSSKDIIPNQTNSIATQKKL